MKKLYIDISGFYDGQEQELLQKLQKKELNYQPVFVAVCLSEEKRQEFEKRAELASAEFVGYSIYEHDNVAHIDTSEGIYVSKDVSSLISSNAPVKIQWCNITDYVFNMSVRNKNNIRGALTLKELSSGIARSLR